MCVFLPYGFGLEIFDRPACMCSRFEIFVLIDPPVIRMLFQTNEMAAVIETRSSEHRYVLSCEIQTRLVCHQVTVFRRFFRAPKKKFIRRRIIKNKYPATQNFLFVTKTNLLDVYIQSVRELFLNYASLVNAFETVFSILAMVNVV